MSDPNGRSTDPAASSSPSTQEPDFLTRRAREKAAARERYERDRDEHERRFLQPLRAILPEWDAAWSELMVRLAPIWQPWMGNTIAGGEPDITAVAASLQRVAAAINLRDAIPDWSPSWLSPLPAGGRRRPDTLRSRLAWVEANADHFRSDGPVVAAALVSFALSHPAPAVAERVRVVLADPEWRRAVGWLAFVPACLWPRGPYPSPPQPMEPPGTPDYEGVFLMDCRRLEYLLWGRFTGPAPDDLFPPWRGGLRLPGDSTDTPGGSSAEQDVRDPGRLDPTGPDDPDEGPPGWDGLGDARRAILTVLAEAPGRRGGRAVATKAGYKYGSLRHHFGPLQTWGYIDRTKDGYSITPGGRALVPRKGV
jgi:hypothetical protein